MVKVERRIIIEAAKKILSGQEFNVSNEEIAIILDFRYEMPQLVMEQWRREEQ